MIGILGTTISSYLFFWEALQEAEEKKIRTKNKSFKVTPKFIRNFRIDNFVGMFFSEITTWSIIAVTASILFTHGITNITSAADAAKALEPLVQNFPHAGFVAKLIFATGIIGLGFLAVPVLAGASAYAFGEACNFRVGLNLKFNQAHGFYGVIIV